MKLYMQTALPDHAYALAPHIRPVDRLEVACSYPGVSVGDALRDGISSSEEAFVVASEGDNTIRGLWGHGLWGCGAQAGDLGFVWFVSDETVFKMNAKTITRFARKVIFPQLDVVYPDGYGNFVHKTNSVHLRWLSACGFNARGLWKIGGEDHVLMFRKYEGAD